MLFSIRFGCLLSLLALSTFGCSSTKNTQVEAYSSSNQTGVVVKIQEGGLSSSQIKLSSRDVLYFYNQLSQEQLSIEIRLSPGADVNGEMTRGFQAKEGVYFTPNLVAPGTLATLNILTKGTYPFFIYGLPQPLQGEILVQ